MCSSFRFSFCSQNLVRCTMTGSGLSRQQSHHTRHIHPQGAGKAFVHIQARSLFLSTLEQIDHAHTCTQCKEKNQTRLQNKPSKLVAQRKKKKKFTIPNQSTYSFPRRTHRENFLHFLCIVCRSHCQKRNCQYSNRLQTANCRKQENKKGK